MYLDANLMETAYAIEHISKLGNVVVRAGCGEFEGERNVCVDVGLGHGYTETANTKSKEAFLETCIFYTHLEVISAPLRERSREELKDALAPWRALVPAADSIRITNTFNPALRSSRARPRSPTPRRPPGARQGTS